MPAPIDNVRFFTIIEDSVKRGKSITLLDYNSGILTMPCYEVALDWYSKYNPFSKRDAQHLRAAYQWMLEGFETEVRAKVFDPDSNQPAVSLYLDELLNYFNDSQKLKVQYGASQDKILDISFQQYYRKTVSRLRFEVSSSRYGIVPQVKPYSFFLQKEYSLSPDLEYYQGAAEGASLVLAIGLEIVNFCLEKRLCLQSKYSNPQLENSNRLINEFEALFNDKIDAYSCLSLMKNLNLISNDGSHHIGERDKAQLMAFVEALQQKHLLPPARPTSELTSIVSKQIGLDYKRPRSGDRKKYDEHLRNYISTLNRIYAGKLTWSIVADNG